MEQSGGTLKFPELGEESYLVGYWHEIGLVAAGSMGPVPLPATEIEAWQTISGIQLSAWESQTLREMSRAYVGQLRDSEQIDCPPPYEAQDFDPDRLAKKIEAAFDRMERRQAKQKGKR